MSQMNHHAHGVPSLKLKNPFYQSPHHETNPTKKMRGYNRKPKRATAQNQRFHMDFGFVRSSDAKEEEKVMVSPEGHTSYLLIVDEYSSRMTWVFPTKSKEPPIDIIDTFLNTYKNTDGLRRICTDRGRELSQSAEFRKLIQKHEYVLETMASESSFQNAIVERPHRTLRNMMRSMLHAGNMSNRFWLDALIHAVYIKNCIPHSTIEISPYEKYSGVKPDLGHLRVFGS